MSVERELKGGELFKSKLHPLPRKVCQMPHGNFFRK